MITMFNIKYDDLIPSTQKDAILLEVAHGSEDVGSGLGFILARILRIGKSRMNIRQWEDVMQPESEDTWPPTSTSNERLGQGNHL